MASDWKYYRLGDLIEVKHGYSFKGEFFRDEPTPYLLLTPGNFAIGGGFQLGSPKYYDGYVPDDFVLSLGELVITMTDLSKNSDTLGYPALVPEIPKLTCLHNQRLGRVILLAPEVLDLHYLYYVCCSKEYRDEILASASGTAVKHTAPSRIKAFGSYFPPLPEQRAIARILGALDDKIELNRRMNRTLEAMAQALFKSWFVNFDPVVAKAEGRTPFGMSAETAALFPAEFAETGDDDFPLIPKGWKVIKLGTIADVNWGDTKTTKASYVANGYPAYSAKGQDGFLPYFDYEKTGVVVSAIGENCGTTWLALEKWSCIKNTIRFWATAPNINTEYLYLATLGIDKWTRRGSAQPFIAQGDARLLKVLLPDKGLAKEFGDIVSVFFKQIYSNQVQSRMLASIRDALLPRLLSGEVRVKV